MLRYAAVKVRAFQGVRQLQCVLYIKSFNKVFQSRGFLSSGLPIKVFAYQDVRMSRRVSSQDVSLTRRGPVNIWACHEVCPVEVPLIL